MESYTPNKSHIKEIQYDPASKKLHVTFLTNGKTYVHGNVPPDVWTAMKGFAHPGKFYHRFIKKRYKLLT